MRFLADINIPQTVIKTLVQHGHDVLDFKKISLNAIDVEIIKRAQKEERIILSRDKDFIILTQYPKYRVPLIAIRLKDQRPKIIETYLLDFIENQDKTLLMSSLTIITEESAESYPYI